MPHETSDAELWRLVLDGQTNAFEQVVERYQGLVSAIAYSRVGDFGISQDVAQETFWVAWTRRDQLREPARLAAWLCGIARNLAHQQTREESKQIVGLDEHLDDHAAGVSQSTLAATIEPDEAELVWKTVLQLPETYREAMILYYRQEHSVAEVAAALDVSEDAVKQRLSRARAMLREDLTCLVEDALVRTRPGKHFTSQVMAALAALGAATASSTVKAATSAAASAAASSAATAAGVATKTVIGSLAPGIIGTVAGTAGGLAGAYLGGYLPAEFAPTMKQRDYLRMRARQLMIISLIFTLLLVIAVGLLVKFAASAVWLLLVIFGWQAVFITTSILHSVKTQRHAKWLLSQQTPDDEPNNSPLRQRAIAAAARFERRSYTSKRTLAGIPLVDIQFSDPLQQFMPVNNADSVGSTDATASAKPRAAYGWIAIGDRAYGILLGVGGLSTGFIASGGLAIGVIATGGCTVGLLSLGGCAIGAIAIGGAALGAYAGGGLAIAWQLALGGGAFAWHAAFGGSAVAMHMAFGGYALARDFAVGGDGGAREFNSAAAKAALEASGIQDWFAWGKPTCRCS